MFNPETFQFPEFLGVRPPEYPLDRAAFDRALATGHGRALIHAQKFGVESYKDLIVDASTHCRHKDSPVDYYPGLPCEGGFVRTNAQGWHLAKLCVLAGVVDEVLRAKSDWRWNIYQQELILYELVTSGVVAAPAHWDQIHSEWVDDWEELIRKDGEAGFLSVARAFGEEIIRRQMECIWSVSAAVEYFDGLKGAGTAARVLAREAPGDLALLHFLRAWRNNTRRHLRADAKETEPAAEIRCAPSSVFSHLGEETLREAALAALARGEKSIAMQLFTMNARDGDSTTVLELALDIAKEENSPDPHPIYIHLNQLYRASRNLRESLIPLFVYEHSLCMLCRGKAFAAMLEEGVCPDWVLEESKYDALESTRNRALGLCQE